MAKDEVQEIRECCREVRLGAVPCRYGEILDGFNTITDEHERWKVVWVDHDDHWRSLVKRIYDVDAV